jgi:uncharacterized repeat protein (TIGR03803 family)
MRKLGFTTIACITAVFCVATAVASSAQSLTTLGSFGGVNGDNPLTGSLIQATDGNFYGTTWSGGKTDHGVVYKVTPSGTISLVYSFCKVQFVCSDGDTPSSLVQAANGNIYGTTSYGGAYDGGTVFEITKSGTFTTLYSFANSSGSGLPLVQGTNGNIYGSVSNTIFQITPAGVLTTLVTLPKGVFAQLLVLSTDGKFYGTTGDGGLHGVGFFFSLTPTGKVTSLYSFTSSTDGSGFRTLILANDGNFYGTAGYGGTHNTGTVFQITPQGQFTNLYNFCSLANCADGINPQGALVQATDGNLYGTTPFGGTAGIDSCLSHCGTAFQITTSGTLTTLYDFCSLANCADGLAPYYGLVQGTDGNFYGATYGAGPGGPSSGGTIYSISVGLGPFVKTNPAFGKAGWTISILGTHLTGTTGVTFNGTTAAFGVISDSLIKAQVPAGATSGTIQVTTPAGTLSSNVAFQVSP